MLRYLCVLPGRNETYRFGDIAANYFSPWLAYFQRKYLNDSAPWRRREDDVYPYGFFYAYYLTMFTIVIVFSTTVPLITVAGAIFFGVMHILDGHRILTVHLKEIESSAGLVINMLIYRRVAILICGLNIVIQGLNILICGLNIVIQGLNI